MQENRKIYIADDEEPIRNIIRSFLENSGFQVEAFGDGESLWTRFYACPADLVILDVMMPGTDGFSIASRIRARSAVPMIFVTARDAETDRLQGLRLGGDDYLTKPFSPAELVLRVENIFRRMHPPDASPVPGSPVFLNGMSLHPLDKSVQCQGQPLSLTPLEFDLMWYLSVHHGRAVTRAELLEKVWGFDTHVETRATDDSVKRIRKKLTEAGSLVRIETVWGLGFRIQD